MKEQELIPHLFRTEYRKIVSVLGKRFGFDQIEIAEDITSDTFLLAVLSWGIKGMPENPVAWLYHVARNKAINYLQRNSVFENKITPELKRWFSEVYETEIDLSPENIYDSQLQMMFAICHPAISPEAQIGLSLRILCGFGIDEIADAFLTSKETINKRLFRAREKLRMEKIIIEMPNAAHIELKLQAVLTTIYLLFNEGYYTQRSNTTLRKDLCLEAMRLCTMLIENETTNKPSVNALLALMCFQSSRFDARLDENGDPVLYDDQDENLWNKELIGRGGYFLSKAATGNNLSKYHLEATIAFWSTQKTDTEEKWKNVLQLYDQLLQTAYSPVAALNRIYAISKVNGKTAAIEAAEKLDFTNNPFYFALLGELYSGVDNTKATGHLQTAIGLAKTKSAKLSIRRKLARL